MSIIIQDIQKNNNEIIRIEVSEFKGKNLINIRTWFKSMDNQMGEVIYKPTQKGVTLNVSEFEELKKSILKLEEYLNEQDQSTN